MQRLHQRLTASRFNEKYDALKERLPRVKHLIHGGAENYYAGPDMESTHPNKSQSRFEAGIVERTISNIELGLERVMGLDMVEGKLYIHCRPRPTQGEKAREAIWQYDIYADYNPVAAIGVNFHIEDEKIISTVANIQGHESEGIKTLRAICGKTPWPVKSLTLIIANMPEDVEIIRGVASTNHPLAGSPGFDKNQASNLYDRTFKKIGMTAVRNNQGKVQYYELQR